MLRGKKIIIGVTGSIAAYKTALLVRLLVKYGAEVKVIMTPSAHGFITPLTLATLSKNPVLTDFIKDQRGEWNNHVELGLWADALVIAPATANTLAKMALGFCDNLLLAVYLSARCPVFFAPAMDLDMIQHPATKKNICTLQEYKNILVHPGTGELASGLTGPGRMAEPEQIVAQLEQFFQVKKKLDGKNILVTAGPTYEAIDPVRFIGNHSSGKMGFAIAEALADRGASVNLVTGPTHQHTDHRNIIVKKVNSADEMFDACSSLFPETDIAVLAAAVADYKPVVKATNKIKKTSDTYMLELTKTPDIAATLGKQKHNGQLIVGFALETEHEEANAIKKLESKNFDMIVLNSLQDKGAGFGVDTNKVTLIYKNNKMQSFDTKGKQEVAEDIANAIEELLL